MKDESLINYTLGCFKCNKLFYFKRPVFFFYTSRVKIMGAEILYIHVCSTCYTYVYHLYLLCTVGKLFSALCIINVRQMCVQVIS